MKKSILVTNLRIDRNDWLQIKAQAGELGISANEYIIYLLQDVTTRRQLASKSVKGKRRIPISAAIWNLANITKKISPKPSGELSEEDKLIYG